MCMFVGGVCVRVDVCLQRQEEDIRASRTEFVDNYDPHNLGVGTQTRVLWESSKCSLPWSHPSSLALYVL